MVGRRVVPGVVTWMGLALLGQRHWVHQRFHPEIAAADHDAGFTC